VVHCLIRDISTGELSRMSNANFAIFAIISCCYFPYCCFKAMCLRFLRTFVPLLAFGQVILNGPHPYDGARVEKNS